MWQLLSYQFHLICAMTKFHVCFRMAVAAVLDKDHGTIPFIIYCSQTQIVEISKWIKFVKQIIDPNSIILCYRNNYETLKTFYELRWLIYKKMASLFFLIQPVSVYQWQMRRTNWQHGQCINTVEPRKWYWQTLQGRTRLKPVTFRATTGARRRSKL